MCLLMYVCMYLRALVSYIDNNNVQLEINISALIFNLVRYTFRTCGYLIKELMNYFTPGQCIYACLFFLNTLGLIFIKNEFMF